LANFSGGEQSAVGSAKESKATIPMGTSTELARFVGPRTVVAAREDDPTDANYKPLRGTSSD